MDRAVLSVVFDGKHVHLLDSSGVTIGKVPECRLGQCEPSVYSASKTKILWSECSLCSNGGM